MNGEFIKNDSEKIRYELITPNSLKELAKVLTHGAKKYTENNWMNCEDKNRYVASTLRHFEAYRSGQLLDEDSCLSHLGHVMANIMFLMHFEAEKTREIEKMQQTLKKSTE